MNLYTKELDKYIEGEPYQDDIEVTLVLTKDMIDDLINFEVANIKKVAYAIEEISEQLFDVTWHGIKINYKMASIGGMLDNVEGSGTIIGKTSNGFKVMDEKSNNIIEVKSHEMSP